MKKVLGILLVFLLSCVFSTSASAYVILDIGELNKLYFQNVELQFDSDGKQVDLADPDVINNRDIQIGDTFVGILNAQDVTVGGDLFWEKDSSGDDAIQVSGIFAQKVVDVNLNTGLIMLTTASQSSFTLLDDTTLDISSYLGTDEMFALYLDTADDGTFTGYSTNNEGNKTIQDNVAAATDSDTGAAWLTLGVSDLSTDYAYSYATLGAVLNYFSAETHSGLSVVTNNTGYVFDLVNDTAEALYDTDVEVAFTAEIEQNNDFAQGTSKWQLSSNDPAIMKPVPEPGTFFLFGLALLGLSAVTREKKA